MLADLNILQRIIEGVPQVERSGDVGGRNDDRERFFGGVDVRIETACIDPLLVDGLGSFRKIKPVGNIDRFGGHGAQRATKRLYFRGGRTRSDRWAEPKSRQGWFP